MGLRFWLDRSIRSSFAGNFLLSYHFLAERTRGPLVKGGWLARNERDWGILRMHWRFVLT